MSNDSKPDDPSPVEVVVVVPTVSDDAVSVGLRDLTRILVTGGHVPGQDGAGGLGGRYGYGVEFDNATFEIHPYYWGDCECGHAAAEDAWCEANDHEDTCYQKVIRQRGFLDFGAPTDLSSREASSHNHDIVNAVCAEMGLDSEFGSYVHCTCVYERNYRDWREANPHASNCRIVVPNFRHKPSGTEVRFYKYIGRGMEIDVKAEWHDIYADCLASLANPEPDTDPNSVSPHSTLSLDKDPRA